MTEFQYIVITGGTGAAWKRYFEDTFQGLKTTTLLYGNQNDGLPFVYSNVRGYYLYRYNMLGRDVA